MTSPTRQQTVTLQPGRLLSLWEIMIRFRAASFSAAVGQLQRAGLILTVAGNTHSFDTGGEDRQAILDALAEAKRSLFELPLSRVLKGQFERLECSAQVASPDVLAALLVELNINLMVELGAAWFLMIPDGRREQYEQLSPAFGDQVAAKWPDASRDIAAASRCYALDEWTASAFHLMRALEHGLRALAADVGLGPEAMAHENWKNIIDQIEAKIRVMEGLQKSPEKIARLKVLSGLAAQFRYFKDAWRNHVSHAHETYDEREAANIWGHVKTFMEQMAAIPSEVQ